MNKVYLVKLVDQDNDIITKVVDQETWDWINLRDSGRKPFSGLGKGESYYKDILCPESVEEKIKMYEETEQRMMEKTFNQSPQPFVFEGVFLSIGSFENDRAMKAPPLDGNPKFSDVGSTTKHTLNLIKTLENLGYELDLDHEYSGLIY
jgi:hypothetical protein